MMKNVALFFLLCAASVPVQAERAVDVHDAWIRHIPGDRPMAGYFVMDNKDGKDRRLVGVSSAAFGAVHIHETVDTGGTTSMQPVESVTVPGGGRVELEPGGHHLMLIQRQKDLEVEDKVSVTLEFEDGGSQSVLFTVKPAWQE